MRMKLIYLSTLIGAGAVLVQASADSASKAPTSSNNIRRRSTATCKNMYKECKQDYKDDCFLENRCHYNEGGLQCMKDCTKGARNACRVLRETCEENEVIQARNIDDIMAMIEQGICPEQPVDCLCAENRPGRGRDLVGGIDPFCSLTWCSSGGDSDLLCTYDCIDCAPIELFDQCSPLGALDPCPPARGTEECQVDRSDLRHEQAVACGLHMCDSYCPYASTECIPSVFEHTQCHYANDTQVIEDGCPIQRNDTACDCSHSNNEVICNTGSKDCHYCSWDCIPTEGEDGFDTRYCEMVQPPIPI